MLWLQSIEPFWYPTEFQNCCCLLIHLPCPVQVFFIPKSQISSERKPFWQDRICQNGSNKCLKRLQIISSSCVTSNGNRFGVGENCEGITLQLVKNVNNFFLSMSLVYCPTSYKDNKQSRGFKYLGCKLPSLLKWS